jgi:SARP family transcriptional regulator, regulator of embCAB operon
MLVARVLPPLPDGQLPQQVSFSKPSSHKVFEVVTPPGGLLVRRLAADLAGLGYELAWVRPLPFESDSGSLASLLLKALAAARLQSPPKQEPAVVVELPGAAQAESLLGQLLSPGAPDAFSPTVVLVVDSGQRPNLVEEAGVHVEVPPWPGRQIQSRIRDQQHPKLPIRQLSAATQGLPSLIEGSLRSLPQLGVATFSRMVAKAQEPDDLTREIASNLLSGASAEHLVALEMASHLGYAHERLGSLGPALAGTSEQPWWVPLADGWLQVDPAWRPTLVRVAGQVTGVARSACLSRLVAELAEEGAVHEGIELCINAGWPGLAADLLAAEAEQLLATGRYAALARWLDRLPLEDHRSHLSLAKLAEELQPAVPRTKALPAEETPAQSPRAGHKARGRHAAEKKRWAFRRAARVSAAQDADSPGIAAPSRWPAGMVHDVLAARTGDGRHHRVGSPDGRKSGHGVSHLPGAHVPGTTVCLEARLLGPFEVLVNGQPIQCWRGNRGRMLLAYLLLHRSRPLTGDELGGVFWPDAAPDVVRNRLHVALYGLRKDLKAQTKQPIVIHSGRGFSIHPRVDLWVDAEAFDEAVTTARKDEGARLETALARYETALQLYRGELLEDTPFEEWALLSRERLRLQHLEALDQVARLHFELGQYAECLDACQRLIPGDLCREDIHRLIMLCYARLNQPHLAARQYHQCRRQLRDELGIEPAETTQHLYEGIRRREFI